MANKRKHVRYKDPDRGVAYFSVGSNGANIIRFPALIVDESQGGMSCVGVLDRALNKGDTMLWEETANIKTSCEIVWCINMEGDIYHFALKL